LLAGLPLDLTQEGPAILKVDLDALKLLDTSAVRIGDDGEAQIPEAFFDQSRKAVPVRRSVHLGR
jgi:hypothetical protein